MSSPVVSGYLLAVACIFGVNLLPAFGPLTWAVLVFLRLNSDLPAVPVVLLGALRGGVGPAGAGCDEPAHAVALLAAQARKLEAAEDTLVGSRGKAVAGLGLFARSPVPSAQPFVAAGLLRVPLVALTAAFFAGRLGS